MALRMYKAGMPAGTLVYRLAYVVCASGMSPLDLWTFAVRDDGAFSALIGKGSWAHLAFQS